MRAIDLVLRELDNARNKYPNPLSSEHQVYGLLKEELDEYWDYLRMKSMYPEDRVIELAQLAAVSIRAIEEIYGVR